MGLENTGFAIANDAMLWIDPLDYQNAFAEGVAALTSAGVRVSIFTAMCVASICLASSCSIHL